MGKDILRFIGPTKERIMLRVSLSVILAALLIFGCQQQDSRVSAITQIDGSISATVHAVSTGEQAKDEATLNWVTDTSPHRWLIQKTDNGTAIADDRIDGKIRTWSDKTIFAGHSYVYNIIAEIDSHSSARPIQIPFKKISIDNPTGDWREEVFKALNFQARYTGCEQTGCIVKLDWNSARVEDVNSWTIERSEGGIERPTKEVAKALTVGTHHNFEDTDVKAGKDYYYHFIAIKNIFTVEGHPLEIRYRAKPMKTDPKKGAFTDFDWQGADKAYGL
ncbi:MAG: hypothetical protein HY537_02860 [Deltaproteobacteria bacterium]|nr:hypothetical protein [Deltaproteobacteria bacterium]